LTVIRINHDDIWKKLLGSSLPLEVNLAPRGERSVLFRKMAYRGFRPQGITSPLEDKVHFLGPLRPRGKKFPLGRGEVKKVASGTYGIVLRALRQCARTDLIN
jgi:hypothetical protein